jgi:hypothetical protein
MATKGYNLILRNFKVTRKSRSFPHVLPIPRLLTGLDLSAGCSNACNDTLSQGAVRILPILLSSANDCTYYHDFVYSFMNERDRCGRTGLPTQSGCPLA